MALTTAEILAWELRLTEEFANTPAPYTGVNVVDIRNENMEEFAECVVPMTDVGTRLGGHVVHQSTRDYGTWQRILTLVHYPKGALEPYENILADARLAEGSRRGVGLMDNYDWFLVTESSESCTEPTL